MAYIKYGLQGSKGYNVRRAVLGKFNAEHILVAKRKLWDYCGEEKLGEFQRQKDSSGRSVKEAHLGDIMQALSKLDNEDDSPTIAIDALSLGTIPRSSPEELNDISVADRMNKLEDKMESVLSLLDHYVEENGKLKAQVNELSQKSKSIPVRSFADVVQNSPVMPTPKQIISTGISSVTKQAVESSGSQHEVEPVQLTYDSTIPKVVVSPVHNRTPVILTQPACTPHAPTASNHQQDSTGSPINFNDAPAVSDHIGMIDTNMPTSSSTLQESQETASGSNQLDNHEIDRISTSQNSHESTSSTTPQDSSEGFEQQPRHRRKAKKKNRVIKGTGPSVGGVTGGSEPSRYLFIKRINKVTEDTAVRGLIEQHGFTIRTLERISHPDSVFKSFKLAVPVTEFGRLFDEKLWPEGVVIRAFYKAPDSRS